MGGMEVPKLKHGIRSRIAKTTGFSHAYVGRVLSGQRVSDTQGPVIDSWTTAQQFAAATKTWPLLWVTGSLDKIIYHVNKRMGA